MTLFWGKHKEWWQVALVESQGKVREKKINVARIYKGARKKMPPPSYG
jgi:hypothetical protein